MRIEGARRIVILGNAGSGKSYLARKLGAAAGLPVIHLDNEFWRPGWEKTPHEEWMARQQELVGQEKWILDGNYNRGLEMRFAAADLVIFLDTNRFICLLRVLRRHGKKRADLPGYLQEHWNGELLEFCKILLFDFYRKTRKNILAMHRKYPDKPFARIKSGRALRRII